MGCGSSAPLTLDSVSPSTATTGKLKAKVKELQKNEAAPAEELARFKELLAIKEELDAEPGPTKKDFLPPSEETIAELRTLTERLKALHFKAEEGNVYTEKEKVALQSRLRLLEGVAGGREAMRDAARLEYTSQNSVAELRSLKAEKLEVRELAHLSNSSAI